MTISSQKKHDIARKALLGVSSQGLTSEELDYYTTLSVEYSAMRKRGQTPDLTFEWPEIPMPKS